MMPHGGPILCALLFAQFHVIAQQNRTIEIVGDLPACNLDLTAMLEATYLEATTSVHNANVLTL